jgi:probable addiction module antidote protein
MGKIKKDISEMNADEFIAHARKRGIKLRRFDAANYLTTEEHRAFYLQEVLNGELGGDPAYVARALGTIARSRGMSKVARAAGMSREGLYKALSGKGNPEFGTILKVIRALGIRLSAQPLNV